MLFDVSNSNECPFLLLALSALTSGENSDSFHFLARANSTNEQMWKIVFKIMAAALFMNIIVAPLVSIAFSWVTSKNLSVEHLYHPVPYVCVNLSKL